MRNQTSKKNNIWFFSDPRFQDEDFTRTEKNNKGETVTETYEVFFDYPKSFPEVSHANPSKVNSVKDIVYNYLMLFVYPTASPGKGRRPMDTSILAQVINNPDSGIGNVYYDMVKPILDNMGIESDPKALYEYYRSTPPRLYDNKHTFKYPTKFKNTPLYEYLVDEKNIVNLWNESSEVLKDKDIDSMRGYDPETDFAKTLYKNAKDILDSKATTLMHKLDEPVLDFEDNETDYRKYPDRGFYLNTDFSSRIFKDIQKIQSERTRGIKADGKLRARPHDIRKITFKNLIDGKDVEFFVYLSELPKDKRYRSDEEIKRSIESLRDRRKYAYRDEENSQSKEQKIILDSLFSLYKGKENEFTKDYDVEDLYTSYYSTDKDDKKSKDEIKKKIIDYRKKVDDFNKKSIEVSPADIGREIPSSKLSYKKNLESPKSPYTLSRNSESQGDVIKFLKNEIDKNERYIGNYDKVKPTGNTLDNYIDLGNFYVKKENPFYKDSIEDIASGNNLPDVFRKEFLDKYAKELPDRYDKLYLDSLIYKSISDFIIASDKYEEAEEGSEEEEEANKELQKSAKSIRKYFSKNRDGDIIVRSSREYDPKAGWVYEHIVPNKVLVSLVNFVAYRRYKEAKDRQEAETKIREDIETIIDKLYKISFTDVDNDKSLNKVYQSHMPDSFYSKLGVTPSSYEYRGKKYPSLSFSNNSDTADSFMAKIKSLSDDEITSRYKQTNIGLNKLSDLFGDSKKIELTSRASHAIEPSVTDPDEVGKSQKDIKGRLKYSGLGESLTNMLFGYYG